MALYLGSFTGGLFSGAQSVFNFYKDYQGVKRQVERDALDEARKQAREEEDAKRLAGTGSHEVPGTRDFTGTTRGTVTQTALPPPESTPASSRAQVSSDSAASGPGPGEVEPGPMMGIPTRGGAYPPPEDAWLSGGGKPREPAPTLGFDAGIVPDTRGQYFEGSPYARAARGAPVDPAYASPTPPPIGAAMMPDRPATDYRVRANAPPSPGVQSDVAAHDEIQPTSPRFPSTTVPVGGYYGRGVGPQSPAIPSAQIGGPYIPPPQQAPPNYPPQGVPSGFHPAQTQGTPPAPEGVAPVSEPIPAGQGNRPYMPPPQQRSPFMVPQEPVPAMPGGPGAPGGRVPLAAAEPPSLGARLLRSLNPVGSAQAAEAPPMRPVGTGDPNAPVQTPPPEDARPQGITPAQPPAAGTPVPAHSPPAPLAVAGTGGKVEQSEATPPMLAPAINPGPYLRAQKQRPDDAAMLQKVIDAEQANGVVTPEQLASHFEWETHWESNHTHGVGSRGDVSNATGIGQVVPGTRDEIDPNHELNPLDKFDGMRLTARYLKHLSVGKYNLGSNTIQTNLAYMSGPGAIALAHSNWPAFAAKYPDAVSYINSAYPGMKVDGTILPGGSPEHGQYDAVAGYRRAQAEGPDGLLSHLAETGPAGLGMSDRWRAYQSALETVLIQSGHPEAVPMAAEWTAQMSQQGTVSHLIAADQAILAGNGQLAINHLAKAHAFFPDHTYAQFGVDNKGNIWGYQLTDAGGTPVSNKPFQVTHEAIARQLIGLQNPVTYQKVLQAFQKENAAIDLNKAHADYYKQLPGIKEEQTRAGIEKAQLAAQAKADHDELVRKHQEETAALHAERNATLDTEVSKTYPTDQRPEKMPEGEYERAADIYRQIRKVPSQGGGDMSQASAKMYADGLAAGNYDMHLMPTKDGKAVYVVKDKQGKTVGTAPLSYEQGELIKPLLGLAGSAPLKEPGAAPPALPRPQLAPPAPPILDQQRTGVGAGAGTYGFNQGMTGLPQRRVA